MPEYPQEGLFCAVVSSGAGISLKRAANDDATFKSAEQLKAIYEGEAGPGSERRNSRLLPDRRTFPAIPGPPPVSTYLLRH